MKKESLFDSTKIAEGSAESSFEDNLYNNLIFAHKIPKAFKDLTEEQKTTLQSLNSALFGTKAKTLTNKDYSSISNTIKRKLFEYAQKDLFTGEVDTVKINMFFASKLYEKLSEIGIDSSVIGKISGELIDFQSAFNKQIKAEPRIKSMMVTKGIASSEEGLEISSNPNESANETYIVEDQNTGKKYYAKTFDEGVSIEGKINPNELFLYKVTEYMGFGPKTDFLVERGSSSAGKSSIFRGNFVLTEDVCGPNQDFFLDVEDNRDALMEFAKHDPRKFAVEISAAAALTDILSMADVFGSNPRNYGIVGNPNLLSDYKIQFVDHQPNSGNGFFTTLTTEDERLAYSPRESLPKKHSSKKLSPLTELALQSKESFVKRAIQDEVHERILQTTDTENGATLLEKAIKQAREDVLKVIVKAEINFMDNAVDHLDKYVEKIQKNIKTYSSSVGKSSQPAAIGVHQS